jgi:hypothetical protein
LFIINYFQWQEYYSNHVKELTAAGTAPVSHRIPFLPAVKMSQPVTKIAGKDI